VPLVFRLPILGREDNLLLLGRGALSSSLAVALESCEDVLEGGSSDVDVYKDASPMEGRAWESEGIIVIVDCCGSEIPGWQVWVRSKRASAISRCWP
jgi:hypothetical protein